MLHTMIEYLIKSTETIKMEKCMKGKMSYTSKKRDSLMAQSKYMNKCKQKHVPELTLSPMQ